MQTTTTTTTGYKWVNVEPGDFSMTSFVAPIIHRELRRSYAVGERTTAAAPTGLFLYRTLEHALQSTPLACFDKYGKPSYGLLLEVKYTPLALPSDTMFGDDLGERIAIVEWWRRLRAGEPLIFSHQFRFDGEPRMTTQRPADPGTVFAEWVEGVRVLAKDEAMDAKMLSLGMQPWRG